MAEFFDQSGIWTWWIVAVLLLIAELLISGIFLMWFGLAAAVVAILTLFVDLPWQAEVALFAGLSVVLVIVARPWMQKRQRLQSDQPNLNQRTRDYVGRSFALERPIENGRGKLRIEDTLWEIEGPDLPAGAWVKVVATDGLRIKVEPGRAP